MEPHFWMNLQAHYDLEVTKDAVGDEIDATVESHAA